MAIWTIIVVYTMAVMVPAQAAWVTATGEWATARGVTEGRPGELYHVLSFFVWGWLLVGVAGDEVPGRLSRRRVVLCALAVFVFSATTESLQSLNPARSARVWHAALNMMGGVAGLACGIVLPLLSRRWRREGN